MVYNIVYNICTYTYYVYMYIYNIKNTHRYMYFNSLNLILLQETLITIDYVYRNDLVLYTILSR